MLRAIQRIDNVQLYLQTCGQVLSALERQSLVGSLMWLRCSNHGSQNYLCNLLTRSNKVGHPGRAVVVADLIVAVTYYKPRRNLGHHGVHGAQLSKQGSCEDHVALLWTHGVDLSSLVTVVAKQNRAVYRRRQFCIPAKRAKKRRGTQGRVERVSDV